MSHQVNFAAAYFVFNICFLAPHDVCFYSTYLMMAVFRVGSIIINKKTRMYCYLLSAALVGGCFV